MAVNDSFDDPNRHIMRSRSKSYAKDFKKEILKRGTSSLEEQLITCPICNAVMLDAIVYDGKTTCLDCCENKNEATPSELLRSNIGKMDGKCPFSDQGCLWVGELAGIDVHLVECEFFEKKCPFADYGCTFKTATEFQMKTHKRVNKIEHFEMKMGSLENENAGLRQKNAWMKQRVEGLLQRNKILKFVETRKMCLEGVEWRVKPEKTGGQLEGPSFYIRGYHLQLVGKVGDNLRFHVRRIPGEFDENLPPARLTYSSAEQVGREKTSNSTHEHKLDLYALSEEIDYGKCAPSILRFYFDIEDVF